jgi:hypothetical protein
VTDLRSFSRSLSGFGTAASCTGPTAIGLIGSSEDAQQLRAGAAALAAADPAHPYEVGKFVPAASEQLTRRLPTGTIVEGHTTDALGELVVQNEGDGDAAATLVAFGKPVVTVYVQGHSTHTVKGIGDGSYQFFWKTGEDWDNDRHIFSRDCGFHALGESENDTEPVVLTFETTYERTQSNYTIHTVTMTPVVGGNAPILPVDPEAFPTP